MSVPRRLAALACCLLALTAGLDATFFFEVLDGSPPHSWEGPVSQEQDEDLDDDMVRAPGPNDRRPERRKDRVGLSVLDLELAGGTLSAVAPVRVPSPLACAPRPGGEHAHRNGLGAPLLC
jgi:hypothetical protein